MSHCEVTRQGGIHIRVTKMRAIGLAFINFVYQGDQPLRSEKGQVRLLEVPPRSSSILRRDIEATHVVKCTPHSLYGKDAKLASCALGPHAVVARARSIHKVKVRPVTFATNGQAVDDGYIKR